MLVRAFFGGFSSLISIALIMCTYVGILVSYDGIILTSIGLLCGLLLFSFLRVGLLIR